MIGIFDSGSGGLTVLRAIREVLPSADVLYFGDIQNAPYGSKSPEELTALTIRAIQLLKVGNATTIVSACNSTSASLAVSLFDALDISSTELIEMVGPTVAYFKGSSERILLCATPATVRSGIYQNAFRMIGKDITPLAIPELAGAIEFGASTGKIQEIIRESFSNVPLAKFDVLILGCTHYPLALKQFVEVLGPSIQLFDPAVAVAERVEKLCWPKETGESQTRFLVSKKSEPFERWVAELCPRITPSIEVVE